MTTTEHKIADAFRAVTVAIQRAIEEGHRSRRIDTDDLIETLLAIADQLDPPLANVVKTPAACPNCGERNADNLVWQDENETVRCAGCGTTYHPCE